ncbi:hypothetical protein INR49_009055 [Caranx melampygus]|nr:hypothetical protein INR49_009055 [Caranx melampygus]
MEAADLGPAETLLSVETVSLLSASEQQHTLTLHQDATTVHVCGHTLTLHQDATTVHVCGHTLTLHQDATTVHVCGHALTLHQDATTVHVCGHALTLHQDATTVHVCDKDGEPWGAAGGRSRPRDCEALQKVAVIIPFRKREEHLKYWLYYLHPILQRQQLDYGVYVINQFLPHLPPPHPPPPTPHTLCMSGISGQWLCAVKMLRPAPAWSQPVAARVEGRSGNQFLTPESLLQVLVAQQPEDGDEIFNRAKLLNVGYMEALKEYDYNCFVFSDVDLIPMDDRNTYRCFSQPRHLSVSMDKFGFRLPYNQYFGGVSSMSKEQYLKINGFPNNYWGLASKGMSISRPSGDVGKCRMIRHQRDKQNEPNPQRFDRIAHTRETMHRDGINSLSYRVVKVDKFDLFTMITVDVGKP